MNNITKRSAAALLAALLGAGSIPAAAVEIDAGEAASSDAVSVQTVTDWSQVSAVINQYWKSDYFGEITVDPDANRAEMDGKKISLQKELDVSRSVAAKIMDSSDAAEQYFEENTDYSSFTDEEGVVHVSDPYQTQRLLVYADELAGDYGASEILHWAEYGEYFLQFDSREATQKAYEQLTAEIGADNCFTDNVRTLDMLAGEQDSDSSTSTTKQCVSWGTSYLGLDVLKQDVENDSSLANETVTAAIIDTGIDTDHEMFEGRKVTGYNFATTDGQEESNYEDTEKDGKGHGTHVAGIITDCTPDNVQLMVLRVFDKDSEVLDSSIEAAIRYAARRGADVVNMSLGSQYPEDPNDPITIWDRALQDVYDKGVAVFAAAGNDGSYHDRYGYSMCYPATRNTTIAISALSRTGRLATYSSYGSMVEFAAPGSDITSAARGGGLRADSGTSMATPHMTGAGAYIKLLHPNCTVEDVRETLQMYAEDLGEVGRDEKYGYGAVHMENYLADSKSGTNFSIPGTIEVTIKYNKMAYTGDERINPVTVRTSSGNVMDSRYYTIRYANNTEIGTATVTIAGQNGYTGSVTKKFSIIPKPTTISKLTNSKSRTMKVQWKTVANCRGYQISYAKNASFKNAKKVTVVGSAVKNRTISKLTKGKRYYVRVRTYAKTKDGSFYGRWSEAKSVKISR